jgi:CheY-like chemotaxis protein
MPDQPDKEEVSTVLVADDEVTVRSLVTAVLRRRGYDVDCAADGQEALEMFEQEPGDVGLILTDLNMPRKNGIELIRDVKAIKPEQPVVAMSGNLPQWSESLGATPTLPKPFHVKTLLDVVEQNMPKPGAGKAQ